MSDSLQVGIVGAGLIGTKRAEAIVATGEGKLRAVADIDENRAETLARKYGAEAVANWEDLILRKDLGAIVVSVPNAFASPIVLAALKSGKHIFCEKPLGVNAKESLKIVNAAKKAKKLVKVGFNHRFHAALLEAHKIFQSGSIGAILFIRARYGHGGRIGMEKEWRFDRKTSGGGELLDQGVHLIDLARWFAGDFDRVYGVTCTKFWRTKVDDNAFALMMNRRVTVSLHASTTNWKNIFSFEVFGETGFLQIEGKGGSYGEELLTYGRRKPEFGVPAIEVIRFPAKDSSWEREWLNFVRSVAGEEDLSGAAIDGLRANRIVDAIYGSSRLRREVKISKS